MISKVKLPQALTLSFATMNAEVTSPSKIKMLRTSKLLVGVSNKGLNKCYIESSESDNLQLKPVAIKFHKFKFCSNDNIFTYYIIIIVTLYYSIILY